MVLRERRAPCKALTSNGPLALRLHAFLRRKASLRAFRPSRRASSASRGVSRQPTTKPQRFEPAPSPRQRCSAFVAVMGISTGRDRRCP